MSETARPTSHSPGRLLHTKLMPPRLSPALIPRAELLARLDDGLGKKLTLVSAPTGFGKTTLVSAWLAARPDVPAAWVTLDASGSRVLEIAPGPGYLSIELARTGRCQVTGLDISRSFVEIASKNAVAAGVAAEFRLGDASSMPFEDETFDFTVCRAVFKNFTRPAQAIAEMYRVLRPGGKSLIIDMRRDASLEAIEEEVAHMKLGGVDKWMTRWTFRHMLLKSAYTLEEMESFVAQTPFGKGRIDAGGIGFELWLERR